MSNLKIVSDLFLENAELNRFKNFLATEGFEADFLNNAESFGVVRNAYFDPSNKYLRFDQGNTLGVGLLNAGYAYDKNHKRIALLDNVNIEVPNDGQWYWLKIKHKYKTTEIGTVSIGGVNRGLLTGIGTKFTEVLRGQPNFPSKIRFDNSVNYQLEYEILQVIDDENALVQGVFDTLEGDLSYIVIGTFTPDYYPPVQDKEPFQYDSIEYALLAEGLQGQQPAYIDGEEFLIARVRNVNNNLDIQDNRYNFQFKTRNEKMAETIERSPNPLIAIESIKTFNFNGRDFYSVNFDWKFNILAQNPNTATNSLSITNGKGGKFKSNSDFTSGDFNGWRLYYENGDYSNILDSYKNTDSSIYLQLDVLKSESAGLCVCPNADSIGVVFNFENSPNNAYMREFKEYPINQMKPTVIFDANYISKINQYVDVKYFYKLGKQSSSTMEFNENTYLIEKAFNREGNLVDDTKTLTSPDLYFNGGVDYGYMDGWRVFYPNEYKLLYGTSFASLDPIHVNSNLKYKLFGGNTVRISGRISFVLGTDQSINSGLAPNGIMFKTPFTWLDDSAVNNACRSWINSVTFKVANNRQYSTIRSEIYYNNQYSSPVEDGTPSDNIACRYIKNGNGMLTDIASVPPFNTYTNPLPTATPIIMDIDILTYFSAFDEAYVNGVNGDDNIIEQGTNGTPTIVNYTIQQTAAASLVSMIVTVNRSSVEQNYKVRVDFTCNYRIRRIRHFLFWTSTTYEPRTSSGSLTMNVLELTKQTQVPTEGIWDTQSAVITGVTLLP